MSATFVEPAASLGSAAEALSDEQILGIEADSTGNAARHGDETGTIGEGASVESLTSGEKRRDDNGADRIALNNDADRNSGANAPDGQMPEWLAKVSEALPGVEGGETRARLAEMWRRSTELDAFDAAYFGEDGAARQVFVERLFAENPAALKAMYEAAGAVMARDRSGDSPRVQNSKVISTRGEDRSGKEGPSHDEFNASVYAEFERATNDAVLAELNREIGRVMDRALPAGIGDGARRRIVDDTLAEVHGVLRGDRGLSRQVAEAVRGGNFGSEARGQVARLIAARGRGVLPAAAKRVIGEWTSSVLATHREGASRQRASEARVDIVGGGVPEGAPRKGMSPKQIDYRRTSDEEILSW